MREIIRELRGELREDYSKLKKEMKKHGRIL